MPFEVTPFFPYLTRVNSDECRDGVRAMIKQRSTTRELMNAKFATALETLKEMSWNRKISIAALVTLICFSLAGCGGGSMSSSTPTQPGHTATGHPTGLWTTLPNTMPINPVHAALLHTGKVLIISGSGNCPATLPGCPPGPAISAGRGADGFVD